MNTLTPTELRKNVYQILDEVLETGISVKIMRKGKLIKIIAVDRVNKTDNLIERDDVITGNSDDLVDIHWQDEVKLDLL